MKLPDNWVLFKSLVLEKIKVYCNTGIWPFDYDLFTSWLSNFDDKTDEYVALHLLDSLIVRSNEMAVSGYSQLLKSDLRQHLIKNNLIDKNLSISSWTNALKRGSLYTKLQFIPIKLSNDHGESGGTIYRLMSKLMNTDRMSGSINDDIFGKTIVLIDDFIGSGEQFEEYAREINLGTLLKRNHIIYSPLLAFDAGLERLSKSFPDLTLMPVETIDRSEGVFMPGQNKELFRNDTENSVDDMVLHYSEMHKKYSPSMPFWRGKDDACLTLVFEWGCPNQTLSILWMEHTNKINNWQQLFSRRA